MKAVSYQLRRDEKQYTFDAAPLDVADVHFLAQCVALMTDETVRRAWQGLEAERAFVRSCGACFLGTAGTLASSSSSADPIPIGVWNGHP